MKRKFLSYCSTVALCAGVLTMSAHAQDAPPAVDPGDASVTEDIIVTATRRETVLLETPGAITAIGGEELATRGVQNATDVDNLAPNLRILDMSNQGMGAVQISLRGISNSSFIEIGDPNVGFHVDGVYMSRPQAAVNLLFDAQRMEIARGPQGTLYGRNATVGSINVVNNRPDTFDFSGGLGVDLGSYNNQQLNGYLNVPVIEGVLALRATAFTQTRDTYYALFSDDLVEQQLNSRFTIDGQPASLDDSPYRQQFGDGLGDDGAGAVDQSAYRVSALFTPFDDFSTYLSYEVFQSNSPNAPHSVRGAEHTAYLSTPHYTDQTIESFRGEVSYEFANFAEAKLTYGSQQYQHEMLVDLDAGTSRYSPELLGTPQPGDLITFEQTFYDRNWTTDSSSTEFTLTSTHGGPLQWLVGYFQFEEDTARNFWIDLPLNGDGIINFNQPSRVAESEALFGRVDWEVNDQFHIVAGLRHTEDARRDTGVNRFSSFPGDQPMTAWGAPVLIEQAGISDLAFLCGFNPALGPCNGVTPAPGGSVLNVNGGWLRAPGLFDGFAAAPGSPIGNIQAGIAAATTPPGTTIIDTPITTDAQLQAISEILSAGGQIALIGRAQQFPRVFFTEQNVDYTDWSLTADWTPREGTLLYATVATGHKAGSQEIFYHPRLGQFINSILEPEELISYEIGWKEEVDFAEGGSFSAALFYMDYTNKQQSVFVNGGDLFCAGTFGDFNGDGFLENFVQFLSGVPIFETSAALVNSGDAILRPDVIGVDGQPSWELSPAQQAQVISDCSQGSTGSGGGLSNTPGVPDFVELMQVNFGNAAIAGLEVEYQLDITADTRVAGYLTYTFINEISDANIDALPFDLNDSLACGDRVGGCPSILSTNGNALPFAPEFTLKAVVEHDIQLGSAGYFTLGGDLTYNGEYYLSVWNTECYESIRLARQVCDNGDQQDAFTTLDLRARYTPANANYFVEIYGRNVTDEVYATGNMRPSTDESVTPYMFNAPAMYGVRAAVNW